MKKIISAVLILSFTVMLLASCASGVSVPYYTLAMDNYGENVFDDYDAITETITYYKDGEAVYEYSLYMEISKDRSFAYNIYEVMDDYTLIGYEGELYSISDGKTHAILQADKKSYYDYVKEYENRDHILDQGEKYQKYSKSFKNECTEVSYYAKVTPIIAADLYEYGITETDRIISTYMLDKGKYYLNIVYSVEHSDGTQEKIAERNFEYGTVRDVFENIPSLEETVDVTIVYYNGTINEIRDTYKVPKGVYVGIDSGDEKVSFYTDAAFENAFDFNTAIAENDMIIYAKK